MTRSDQEPSGARQIGALCRWDGTLWEPLTGPEVEEAGSEAFLALYDLLITLGALDGKKTAHRMRFDQAAQWHHALEQAEDAYHRLGSLMERWGMTSLMPGHEKVQSGEQCDPFLLDAQYAIPAYIGIATSCQNLGPKRGGVT